MKNKVFIFLTGVIIITCLTVLKDNSIAEAQDPIWPSQGAEAQDPIWPLE